MALENELIALQAAPLEVCLSHLLENHRHTGAL